jgi:hypothetical protein
MSKEDVEEQKEGIGAAIDRAEWNAKNVVHLINNSAPLMNHDIEKDGCNGLADCPVCTTPTANDEFFDLLNKGQTHTPATQVEEQKEGCCELCRATLHNGVWTCWRLFKGCCHTPQTPTPQEEQKEGVKNTMFVAETYLAQGAQDMLDTPTVKEESHTQGWEKHFRDKFVDDSEKGVEPVWVDAVGCVGPVIAFIKDVAVTEREAERKEKGSSWRDGYTRGLEEGYAQCKVDAVAVVPTWLFPSNGRGYNDGWNDCRQYVLTALSSFTHKKE